MSFYVCMVYIACTRVPSSMTNFRTIYWSTSSWRKSKWFFHVLNWTQNKLIIHYYRWRTFFCLVFFYNHSNYCVFQWNQIEFKKKKNTQKFIHLFIPFRERIRTLTLENWVIEEKENKSRAKQSFVKTYKTFFVVVVIVYLYHYNYLIILLCVSVVCLCVYVVFAN